MLRKILVLSLVLVMALPFVACDGEDLPSAQEIINASAEAQEDVRTFEFEMEASMDMDVEAEVESIDLNLEIDGSGAMDMENMANIQMQMDATMNLEIPGEGDMDVETEMYLVDNTFYIMTMADALGMGPMWMKLEIPELAELSEMEELPEEYWDQAELLEFQQEVIEALEIEVTGSERVDGIDCYVLEINPDMEQFWQMFMEMFETMGLETTDMTDMPEDFGYLLDEMFNSFSMKEWIAKDTYLPMKVEIEVSVEVNPEEMGYPEEEGEVALDLSMTMLMFNYNQPVSIELPPEAEDAMDIMDFMDYTDY